MQAPFEVVEALRHVNQTFSLSTMSRKEIIQQVSEGTHEGAWLNQVAIEDWDSVIALALAETPSTEAPVAKRGKRGVQTVPPVDVITKEAPPTEETPEEPKVDSAEG